MFPKSTRLALPRHGLLFHFSPANPIERSYRCSSFYRPRSFVKHEHAHVKQSSVAVNNPLPLVFVPLSQFHFPPLTTLNKIKPLSQLRSPAQNPPPPPFFFSSIPADESLLGVFPPVQSIFAVYLWISLTKTSSSSWPLPAAARKEKKKKRRVSDARVGTDGRRGKKRDEPIRPTASLIIREPRMSM